MQEKGIPRPSNRREKSAEAAHPWVSGGLIGKRAVLKRREEKQNWRGEEDI